MNHPPVTLLDRFSLLTRAIMKYSLILLCLCLTACNQKNIRPSDIQSPLSPQKTPSLEQQSAEFRANMMAKIKQDKYLSAFLFSGYPEAPVESLKTEQPSSSEAIPKPETDNVIPSNSETSPGEIEITPEVSHLVNVEVWNIILGQEKVALLKKAQALGANQLPNENEWHRWKMAIGNIEGDSKKTIIFLAPPDFDKFKNGDHLVVEISSTGGVHTARYLKNE